MSIDNNTDPQTGQAESHSDRRARRRREPGKLGDEISTVLSEMDPEVREDLGKVVKAGSPQDIEEKLLDYVVKDERTNLLRKADQKRASGDKRTINRGTYLISLIPVAIALYCVFSIVFTGHIVLPWDLISR